MAKESVQVSSSNAYPVVSMGKLLQEAERGLLSPDRTLCITGKPGIAKSALARVEFPKIMKRYYEAALPQFFDEARALLEKHDAILEGVYGTKQAVGAVIRCERDFKNRHKNLRVAYDWLEWCRDYGHEDIFDMIVEDENQRLSQIDSTMLRGYPKDLGGRMVYIPDVWFPLDKFARIRASAWLSNEGIEIADNGRSPLGILNLDEANRGKQETQQAAFQLIEFGHAIGAWAMKSGWSIVICANMGSNYDVAQQDAAWIGRITILELRPDIPTWETNFAMKKHANGHANIFSILLAFLRANKDFFIAGDEVLAKAVADENKYPSPRDWEAFSVQVFESLMRKKLGLVAESYLDDTNACFTACAANVGPAAAHAFIGFLKMAKDRLEPVDVIGNLRYGNPLVADIYNKLQAMPLHEALEFVKSLKRELVEERMFDRLDYEQWSTVFMISACLPPEAQAASFADMMRDASGSKDQDVIDMHRAYQKKYLDWFTPIGENGLPSTKAAWDSGRRYNLEVYPEKFLHPMTGELVNFHKFTVELSRQARASSR